MDFLQLFILLLLVSILPLVNIPLLYFSYEYGKYIVFLIFGTVLLFIQGIKLLTTKYHRFARNDTLLLFVFIYFISTIFSINPLVSIFGYYGSFTGGLLYIVLLLFLSYISYSFRKDTKIILQTIFLSGVTVSVVGLWQYINHISRISSTIGQPNRLAFFLLAVIPIGLYLFNKERNSKIKYLYFTGVILLYLAFFLTFSRSTYLVLLLLTILIIVKEKLALLSVLTIGFFVFGLVFLRSIPSTISNYPASSLALRLAEWQGSWEAIRHRDLQRQLIGYGPETVYYTFFKYRPVIYNRSQEESGVGPNQIRNYYLHLLSGIGILGLLAYLFLLKKILISAYYKNLGIFYSLLGISVMSLFYYQTDTVMLIFWILTGLVYE